MAQPICTRTRVALGAWIVVFVVNALTLIGDGFSHRDAWQFSVMKLGVDGVAALTSIVEQRRPLPQVGT